MYVVTINGASTWTNPFHVDRFTNNNSYISKMVIAEMYIFICNLLNRGVYADLIGPKEHTGILEPAPVSFSVKLWEPLVFLNEPTTAI